MTTTSPHEGIPERIDPLKEPIGVVSYHLAKYAFARGIIGRERVLDVACGVGYGSAFLAEVSPSVVGLELASEAIDIARSRYLSGRCSFIQADAELLPIATASVGAVVCFEGIEHFRDPSAHLGEVARVLQHEGCYIVSTPHPDAHTHGDDNPFHLHEFDVESFRSILGSRFASVDLLGQRRKQSSSHAIAQRADILGLRRAAWMRPFTRLVSRSLLRTRPTEETMPDDFVIEPWTPDATEYVAVCRQPRP